MVSHTGVETASSAPSQSVTIANSHTTQVRRPNHPLSESTPRPHWPWPAVRYRAWRAPVAMHAALCHPRHMKPSGRRRTLGQRLLARAAGPECKRGELRLESKPVVSRSGGTHGGRGARVSSLAEVVMRRRSNLEASKPRVVSRAAHRLISPGPQRLVVLCKGPSNNRFNRSAQELRSWVPVALRAPAPG